MEQTQWLGVYKNLFLVTWSSTSHFTHDCFWRTLCVSFLLWKFRRNKIVFMPRVNTFLASLVMAGRNVSCLFGCAHILRASYCVSLLDICLYGFLDRVQRGLGQKSSTWVRKSPWVHRKSKLEWQSRRETRKNNHFLGGVRRWHKESCQVCLFVRVLIKEIKATVLDTDCLYSKCCSVHITPH